MNKTPHVHLLLGQLGLSEAEIQVYTSLLSMRPSLVIDIAKKTGLYRPAVYKALERLEEKGLVRTLPKGKRLVYGAETPEKLETLFKNFEAEFFNHIEDLHSKYEAGKGRLNVVMGEGDEAIVSAYSDVVHSLDKNETYYRYSSLFNLKNKKQVPKDYERTIDKKGLERLIITGERNKPSHKRLGRSFKSIPAEFDPFEDEVNVIIYGDKVAIVDYNSKSTMTIKHQKFADFQKKIFKLLYSKL